MTVPVPSSWLGDARSVLAVKVPPAAPKSIAAEEVGYMPTKTRLLTVAQPPLVNERVPLP